ncbi:hypothetical protein ACFL0P_00120 [Candidatus Omnitrophota bacterium]
MKKKKVKKKARRRSASKKKRPAKKAKKKVVRAKKKKIQKPKKKAAKKIRIPLGVSLEEIGIVTHYFSHVEAAVVKLTAGSLLLGDTVVIKGHTTEFKEKVDSIQLDRASITSASAGQEIGLKVKSRVREHDLVYKLVV